jgi:long-chain fatty acid transport protein
METAPARRTRVAAALGGLVIALSATHASGAACALRENTGSAIGHAFAGSAAAAEDASTLWSNPAGMSRLSQTQVAVVANFITPSFKFKDEGSLPAAFQPLGGTGGDAGSLNVVPSLYAALPIDRQWSFGVGVDWQRIDAELTSRVNYSAALAQGAGQAAAGGLIPAALVPQIIGLTPGLESKVKVEGDDSTWGWNIGFLWDATPQTRIGAHYRSSVKYKVSGEVSFDHPALPTLPAPLAPVVGLLATNVNAALPNGGVTADIKLPDIANLSVFHRLNERWDVMGDVQFTRWSVFKQLEFVRTTGAILATTPENFDDAWRFSVGATYRWNDAWSFRGGLAYDQSPVNTADRTARLPDSDRVWIAVGAQYRFNRNLTFDAGYVYIPMRTGDIDQNAGSTAANGLVKGHYESNVNLVSAQITYTFQ